MTRLQKNLLSVCVIGLALAVGAYYLAREQDRIRNLFGPKPQVISVADLAARGYGDNVWLELTDVELGKKYVVETRKGSMSAVWFPAFPQGEVQQAKAIQVILRSTRCKSEADIAQRFGGPKVFRGAVTNPILLRPYEPYRPLLQQSYPELALAPTIWEVDVDYAEPPSPQWAQGFDLAAAVLGVSGVLCGLGALISLAGGRRAPPGQ